jgi:Protein of unknown function (DUF2889)
VANAPASPEPLSDHMPSLTPGAIVHTRTYDIQAVVVDDQHFKLIGRINDVKPDGLWGIRDTKPMSLHDMTVELTVRVNDVTIVDAHTTMTTHPQLECQAIVPAYQQLVGLSIARGFTQKVKELFGGPRACTHIGALINAMAPVAMQTLWAFSNVTADEVDDDAALAADESREARIAMVRARNRNSCHVWADGGPMVALLEAGNDVPVPLWAVDRLGELGLDIDAWRRNAH